MAPFVPSVKAASGEARVVELPNLVPLAHVRNGRAETPMRATLFIVHPNDGVLRALSRLLVEERYAVRAADTLDAAGHALAGAPRPALLIVDEDACGPRCVERLAGVPADVPRLFLTWTPGAPMPANVTALGKPFRARELLDAISRGLAGGEAPSAPER